MRRNVTRKFLADGVVLAFGLLISLITARELGPDGRGVFATVSFVAGFAGAVSVLGLGEALIIAIGRGETSLRRAIGSTLAAVTASSLVFGLAVFAAVAVLTADEPHSLLISAGAACTVPISALTTTLSYGHVAEGRFGTPILAVVFVSFTTLAAMAAILLLTDAYVEGAILAVLVGAVAGLGLLVLSSLRHRLLSRSIDASLIRLMLPNGLRLVASGTLILLSTRLDLLFVFLLAGDAAAGRYSIALTVSALAASAAFAITYASFPSLAYTASEEWRRLSRSVIQMSVLTTVLLSAALAVLSPFAIPLLFGSPFDDAVVPTLVLLAGAAFASLQFTLGRVVSAQGHPSVPLKAYAVSLTVMLLGDLVLIGPLGGSGAAIAFVLSSVTGVVTTIRGMRRVELAVEWRDLVPTREAFAALARVTRPHRQS